MSAERPTHAQRSARRIPRVSLILGAAALLAYGVPGTGELLQFDRGAIGAGQVWRIITGHWTHWSAEVLFWDVAVFVAVGAICERMYRKRYLVCVGLSALAIPLAVWLAHPGMQFYRGLSGIDSALVALLAAEVVREKIREREWAWVLAGLGLFVAFAAKIGFELSTGATVFADNADGVLPVPLAHVVGVAAGVLAAITGRGSSRRESPRGRAWPHPDDLPPQVVP